MKTRARLCLIAVALAASPALAAASAESNAPASNAQTGNAEAGRGIFALQCGDCHAAKAGVTLFGPSLYGVVGRKAGTLPGYNYSAAMRASGRIWSEAALDTFLTAPRKDIPGIRMWYAGLSSAGRRADVIAYLATLHR